MNCQPFIWLSALTSFSLSACVMGPDFHSPEAPKTETYTQSALNSGKDDQVFQMREDLPKDWWNLFHSESISDLVKLGLQNNPNLSAAKASLKEAQENVNAAIGNDYFPQANLQLSATRQLYNQSTAGSNAPSLLFNLYNASVNVSYTFDLFGAERRQIEGLRAQVDYQHYEMLGAYLSLTANIVTSSISLASYEAKIEATQKIIYLQEKQLEIMKKQLVLGGLAQSDILSQETLLANTRASLPPLEQGHSVTQHSLAVLVGSLPSDFKAPTIHLDDIKLPHKLPLSLPSRLVQQRPDIQASEALLHAANAGVGVATANLFPQITLSGNDGWQAGIPGKLFSGSSEAWSIGGSLLQPVFHGGALKAQQRAAFDAYEAALSQYRQVVLQAFQNVADSLRALEHDANAFQANEAAETSAFQNFQLSEKQYREGAITYLILLNAERDYQQALINRIQAQSSRLSDTAALFQALGGAFLKSDKEEKA